MVVHIVGIGGAVRHQLHGGDAVLQHPYLQFAVDGAVDGRCRDADVEGMAALCRGRGRQRERGGLGQLLLDGGCPLGVVDRCMAVHQSDGLVFQVPVVIVFVARLRRQSEGRGVALEAQRSAVDADGNDGRVAVGLHQLVDDLRALRTVHALLTGEVLQQHRPSARHRLLVDQPVLTVDMIASGQQQCQEANRDVSHLRSYNYMKR